MENQTTTTYVEIDLGSDNFLEVQVDWEFSPYDPGKTYGPAEDCYPPEGGELESCAVWINGERSDDGEDWLIEHMGQDVFEYALEAAQDKASSDWGQDDRGDYDYERARDELRTF